MFGKRKKTNRKRIRQRQSIERRLEQQSYYQRQANADVVEKENRLASFSRLGARMMIMIAAIGLIGYLLYVNRSPIIRIQDQDKPIQNLELYEKSAQEIMRSSPAYLTKITFGYQSLREQLIEKHPEIANVRTTFGVVADQPVISLEFHLPTLLMESGGKEWLIDSNGVAIANITDKEVNEQYANLHRVKDSIGLSIQPRQPVFSLSDVSFIARTTTLLKGGGMDVQYTTLPINPREINAILAPDSMTIRMNMDEDPDGQVGTALVALEKLAKNGIRPSQYIDVRPGEKVYWK